MKFVKLKHYMTTDDCTLSVITMSDGLDYISYYEVFAEVTPTNLALAIMEVGCLDILFRSRSYSLNEIVDATYMFAGSSITEFCFDMPLLNDAYSMFLNCKDLVVFNSNMPELEHDEWMFTKCSNLKNRPTW